MTRPGADASVVVIRRASTDDAEALARLRWEFRAAIGQADEAEDAFVARCAAWMRARLAEGAAWRAWVAEVDGEAAGTAWLQLIEKMPNPVDEAEVHGYVTNLYVREAARGGVGGRLLAAVLDECARAGVHQAFLWPTQRSRDLYRRFGFTGDGEVMVWVRR
jgi:N-acetylglutamate synthase-like GNAT family acetyltransferase